MRRQRKIGLALGSGGARGMSHLGVLQRLAAWGIPIHCIAGTSIGAIVGAIALSGKVDEVAEWAEDIDWKVAAGLFAETPALLTKPGFIKGERIDRKIREYVSCRRYEDLPKPFATVATDVMTGEEVVMRSGDLLSGVHASFSIPGIFVPVERDGRHLVDGGLVNPLPISVCRELGADVVIAVDINQRLGPEGIHHQRTRPNLFDVLANSVQIMENEVTRATIAAQAPDVLIQPAVGSIRTLEFKYARLALEAGRAAADECEDAILELVGDK